MGISMRLLVKRTEGERETTTAMREVECGCEQKNPTLGVSQKVHAYSSTTHAYFFRATSPLSEEACRAYKSLSVVHGVEPFARGALSVPRR